MSKTPLPDFDQWWDYDRPGETEQAFRRLLPQARAAGDQAYLAELLTQIARTEGLQRQFAAAHHTLDEVERLLPGQSARPRIRYLMERGRVFNSAQEGTDARDLFLHAWELAVEADEEPLAIDAAHMLAIVEPPAQQLEWNLRALALAERSSNVRAQRWRGSLYNNIGWTYHGLGRDEDALTFFRKALDARVAEGLAKEIHIAEWCVARALRSLGRVAEALEIQRDLLRHAEAAGTADGYVHEELGECLWELGQNDEARPHFAQANAVLSQDAWLVATDAPRLQRLAALGQAPQSGVASDHG